jgi:hypothetical protein
MPTSTAHRAYWKKRLNREKVRGDAALAFPSDVSRRCRVKVFRDRCVDEGVA